MALRLIAGPTEEPISLLEAKAHLRVDHTPEDPAILGLVRAARGRAETITGRKLVLQTWEQLLDRFPCAFVPPWAPLKDVTSIKYRDDAGVEQTLAADQYQVDAASEPARIVPAFGVSWPSTAEQVNAVTLRFRCGYDTAAAVPDEIRQAILLLLGHWYENREAVVANATFAALPLGVEALLMPHRLWGA